MHIAYRTLLGSVFIGAIASTTSWLSAASVTPSATDLFQNAIIDSASPGRDNDGDVAHTPDDLPAALFDATATSEGTTANVEAGHFLFFDGASGVKFVDFHTSAPVTIAGINLFDFSDSGQDNGNRGLSGIRFFQLTAADVLAGATQLVNIASPSNSAGGGFNVTPQQNGPPNSALFAPTTGQFFRLEIDSPGGGTRLVELDAVAPEPSSLALIGLGSLSMLRRRSRS